LWWISGTGHRSGPSTDTSSPTLTLGATVPVDLALDLPYRFSIEGKNTTPVAEGKQPTADVIAGDLQFLCHVAGPRL